MEINVTNEVLYAREDSLDEWFIFPFMMSVLPIVSVRVRVCYVQVYCAVIMHSALTKSTLGLPSSQMLTYPQID